MRDIVIPLLLPSCSRSERTAPLLAASDRTVAVGQRTLIVVTS